MTETPPVSDVKNHSVVSLTDFDSRTNLTEAAKLDDDDYDPFTNRDQEKGTPTGGALVHLLKCSLGTGVLAMPLAFSNAGTIFGMVGTIVIGILCTHCVHLLVKVSHAMCRKAHCTSLGYAETAEKAFEYGPVAIRKWALFARLFVDYGLMGTYFAGGSVYMVFIGTSFHDVVNYDYDMNWDVQIYIALTTIACLFIGQVRSLKWLVPYSLVANICTIITFAITLYYMFNEPLNFSDKPYVAGISQIPLFFATVVFALEGIGAVMPVENSMKKPQHFLGCPGVLYTAMSIVVSMYAIIGFFGYVRFGSEIRGSITLNLEPGEPLADAAKLLMAMAIFFTFGLQMFVPIDILWRKISHKFAKKNRNIIQLVLRIGIILILGGIAIAIPNLEPFISLVGAIFFSLLGIFTPSFLDIIYLWPDRLGVWKWKLFKNILLCALAIFALVAGSSASIEEIIGIYK